MRLITQWRQQGSGGTVFHARDGGQTLAARLRRFLSLLRTTGGERGVRAAGVLLGRTLLHKGPMLVRQIRAARHHAAVRAAIAATRAEIADREPYVAISFAGGLGDLLVVARFLRDLAAQAGPFRFDMFCATPHLATWALRGVAGFRAGYHDILFERLTGDYDAALRVTQFVVVYEETIRWPALRRHQPLAEAIEAIIRFRPQIDRFIARHPWLDNGLARSVVAGGHARRDFLQHIAGLRYGGERLPVPSDASVLARHGLAARRYVTVHNGFDTGYVISGQRATKCYPHFGAVVARLKVALPHMTFVQIGTVTSERIVGCDRDLLGRTSLAEAAGLLHGAALHLDNEGGLVHLAACLGTRSAVMFGPTPSDYFGYPGNLNLDPPVCGDCWWLTRTWMDVCAQGYATPRCLDELDPHLVAERVLAALQPPLVLPEPATVGA